MSLSAVTGQVLSTSRRKILSVPHQSNRTTELYKLTHLKVVLSRCLVRLEIVLHGNYKGNANKTNLVVNPCLD